MKHPINKRIVKRTVALKCNVYIGGKNKVGRKSSRARHWPSLEQEFKIFR